MARHANGYLRRATHYFGRQRRDSRYVFVFVIAAVVLLLSTLQALSQGLFDSVERPVFQFINGLPPVLHNLMYLITQFGGLGSLLFWGGLAWYIINRRAALQVVLAGWFGWIAAKILKDLVNRGRPETYFDTVNLFNAGSFGGYGFPSGHSTFAAACATVLYYQIPKTYRKYVLLIVFMVGFSRMYLGAHFPLDVVGGWALGALIGSTIMLVSGVSNRGLSAQKIKKVLRRKGYDIAHLRFANVDARGSRPVFMVDQQGTAYFGKIFGVQEHAADWLFKIYRFFRFKNLQGEEPYISGRRNIELESFATMWANQAGVRVPVIVDLVRIGSSYMLIQQKLDAAPLSEQKRVRTETLTDVWEQVRCLHEANMAHRDLRAANVMVDKQGKAWLIDFGFAEVSPKRQRQYMDLAELLMSMSLVAGVDRTVDTALGVIEHDRLVHVLPYLKREVFSGATAQALKKDKQLLKDLKHRLMDKLDVEEDIKEADIVRINSRKIINLTLLGAFLYVVVPQFKLFKGTLASLASVHTAWLVPLVLASMGTYVATAIIYMALATVPLRLWPTTVVQLAASFMSKVVPGGVGSTGINARYMHRAGMDTADSAAVLTTQGIVGFLVFAVPLGLFLIANGQGVGSLIAVTITPRQIIAATAVVIGGVVVLGLLKSFRKKVVDFVANFATSIREFTNSPREISLAAGASFAVSMLYILCLYFSFKAFAVPLGIGAAVFVYASAVIARSVVPTPGGLGPLEIAMVSTMIGLGVGRPEALSVVVLYRMATFWLPVPFSYLAYRFAIKRRYI